MDLKSLARRGAEARTAELNTELADIYRAFPDLRSGRGERKVLVNHEEQFTSRAPATKEPPVVNTTRRGRRRKMGDPVQIIENGRRVDGWIYEVWYSILHVIPTEG